MIWALAPQPGNHHCAVWCDDEAEYDTAYAAVEAGTLTYRGQALELQKSICDREHLFLRFYCPEGLRLPPLRIVFEDEALAERIEAVGWYTFEGGLYRVLSREGGRLTFDRVFMDGVPTMYHGDELPTAPDSKIVA